MIALPSGLRAPKLQVFEVPTAPKKSTAAKTLDAAQPTTPQTRLEQAQATLENVTARNSAALAAVRDAETKVTAAREALRAERSEAADNALAAAKAEAERVKEWAAVVAQDLVDAQAAFKRGREASISAEIAELQSRLADTSRHTELTQRAADAFVAVIDAMFTLRAHVAERNALEQRAFMLRTSLGQTPRAPELDSPADSDFVIARRLAALTNGKSSDDDRVRLLLRFALFLSPNTGGFSHNYFR